MIFQYICPPASLYLAFSIIQILIDMFRGETNTAFLKFLVMIIFTIALNMLCASGLGIISWFIVFIPFILMTYITTILVFVFGIPKTSNLRPERRHPRNEHDRNWWKHHKHVGGCAGTQYGCCDDGQTAKVDANGTNCPSSPQPSPPVVGGCAGTQYGCCIDGTTTKVDANGTNCQNIGGCAGTQYGCCIDGTTTKVDANGTNCQNIGGCAGTQYGCCADGTTTKVDANGTNCQTVGGCAGTQYGCCNDGTSPNPCPKGTSLVLDPEQSMAPKRLIGGCAGSQYGCCSDGSFAAAKTCGVFNPVI